MDANSHHIARTQMVQRVREALRRSPVAALVGPRQAGKTWLARQFASSPDTYFDAEDFVDRARLENSNYRILDGMEGVLVVDEAQLLPDLFRKVRVLVDRPGFAARILLTGSASPELMGQISESLAGRISLLQLGGFTTGEVGIEEMGALWRRGGFPRAFGAATEEDSFEWRLNYISTFLNGDLRQLADSKLSYEQMRRLLLLVAHSHGQHWNHSEAGAVLGVNYKTIQRHIEILKGAFLIRELPLYHANVRKRLRKAPRYYFRDSGLLHALLSLRDDLNISSHPRYGASWEGFCIEEIMRATRSRDDQCFTWSVQGGQEIDLVLTLPTGVYGFEFKAGDAPGKTASMITCREDLDLERIFVVYPGSKSYPLHDQIEAVGFQRIAGVLDSLIR